jgi:hypothetical protein
VTTMARAATIGSVLASIAAPSLREAQAVAADGLTTEMQRFRTEDEYGFESLGARQRFLGADSVEEVWRSIGVDCTAGRGHILRRLVSNWS